MTQEQFDALINFINKKVAYSAAGGLGNVDDLIAAHKKAEEALVDKPTPRK